VTRSQHDVSAPLADTLLLPTALRRPAVRTLNDETARELAARLLADSYGATRDDIEALARWALERAIDQDQIERFDQELQALRVRHQTLRAKLAEAVAERNQLRRQTVAAKLGIDQYGSECEVVYCDTMATEHPDNARFFADVEGWIGRRITRIRSDRYQTIDDVFEKRRYLAGPRGALCTVEMKKMPREAWQRPDDVHIFGYTSDEVKRA
jgi:hypothetical protein